MRNRYTDEQKAFIIQHGPHLTTEELCEALNTHFGCDHSAQSIRTTAKRLGVYKTKKTISRSKKHPLYKIGDSRIINGYEYVKTSESVKGFYNQWERKGPLVWKRYNGEIPNGYHIVYLNGNTLDSSTENLACISNVISARMANGHGKSFWNENPEITKTGLLVCELDETINKFNTKKEEMRL